MRHAILVTLSTVGLLVTAVAPALAAADGSSDSDSPGAAYVRNLEFVGDRAVQLAEAIPEEAYGWRPMDGVRSVSEALMHMASANYFFAGRLGTPPPENVDPGAMEEITDKDEVVSALEASLEHLAEAYAEIEDVHATTDIFGREGTIEDLMLITIGHVHEHFGQLIAYARSNEIVPPWSRSEE